MKNKYEAPEIQVFGMDPDEGIMRDIIATSVPIPEMGVGEDSIDGDIPKTEMGTEQF